MSIINEECTEIDESSQNESGDEFNDSFKSNYDFDNYYENLSSSTNGQRDNSNASTGWKRMRLLTDSEGNSEEINYWQNIEIAIDGPV